MEIHEQLFIGDVVEMRKPHPCGGYIWEIVRVGADIGLICHQCQRRVLLPRRKFARQAKKFMRRGAGPLATGEESAASGRAGEK